MALGRLALRTSDNTFWVEGLKYDENIASTFIGDLPGNGSTRANRFSPDGRYVVASSGTHVKIYKVDYWALVSDELDLDGGTIRGVRFSPDGKYIAVGDSTIARLTLLRHEKGEIYVATIYTLPGVARDVSYSKDGKFLAVTHFSGGVTLLKQDGDVLQSVGTYSLSGGTSIEFSPEGTHIAVSMSSSPYFRLLKWNGTSITLASTYTFDAAANAVAFSKDSKYIAVGGNITNRVQFLKRTEDSVSFVADLPANAIPSTVYDLNFSSDGYLIVGNVSTPQLSLVKHDEDDFTIVNQYNLPNSAFSASFSPSGKCISAGHAGGGRFRILWREEYPSWKKIKLIKDDI